MIGVDEIDADGGVAQAHFAGAGLTHAHGFVGQHFRTAGLVKTDGMAHNAVS
ncbi:hypothetical protein [Paludibacterium denitrificans]|uniref:hypothetical protein n=1 Tax=Paludibacterium denitrificans TaxID=2675226 RepID=UPI001E3B1E4C|nr:hypothetical protein [Paludibacterium denitrificans]